MSSTDKVKRIRFRFAYEESPLLIIIEKNSTDYLRVAQYSSVFRRGLVVVKPPSDITRPQRFLRRLDLVIQQINVLY